LFRPKDEQMLGSEEGALRQIPAQVSGVCESAGRLLGAKTRYALNVACTLSGVITAVGYALIAPLPVTLLPAQSPSESGVESTEAAERAAMMERVRYRGDEFLLAAYVGAPYTFASDVRIEQQVKTMTVHDVDWRGKPFDDPIYYGVRVARWLPQSSWGTMLDFMHSKAYAPLDQRAKVTGALGGAPLPSNATIGDIFHKLEFTHGHNVLTLNVLRRLPSMGSLFSPYLGVGLGAALPHTEVQIKGQRGRTYAYQYAGPAAQLVLGIEIRVPRLSYLIEYKFTSASYRVPLQNFDGSWLPLDLWAQFKRWWRGEAPLRGWASTWLTSHQVVAGMGIRTVPSVAKP
jgi:lipid A oxidase